MENPRSSFFSVHCCLQWSEEGLPYTERYQWHCDVLVCMYCCIIRKIRVKCLSSDSSLEMMCLCCCIAMESTTAASQNGFSSHKLSVIRKPILLSTATQSLCVLTLVLNAKFLHFYWYTQDRKPTRLKCWSSGVCREGFLFLPCNN